METKEIITPASELDALYGELDTLVKRYGSYLSQEELEGDVQCLKQWIEFYQQGDSQAAEYLRDHGKSLLENIRVRMQSAAEDIQRMDDESPNAENFTGGKSDRLNRVVKVAMSAEEKLDKVIENETVH